MLIDLIILLWLYVQIIILTIFCRVLDYIVYTKKLKDKPTYIDAPD